MFNCPNCGTELQDGVRFCRICGQQIEQPAQQAPGTFCSTCGSEVPAGNGFCPQCGTPVEFASAQDAQPGATDEGYNNTGFYADPAQGNAGGFAGGASGPETGAPDITGYVNPYAGQPYGAGTGAGRPMGNTGSFGQTGAPYGQQTGGYGQPYGGYRQNTGNFGQTGGFYNNPNDMRTRPYPPVQQPKAPKGTVAGLIYRIVVLVCYGLAMIALAQPVILYMTGYNIMAGGFAMLPLAGEAAAYGGRYGGGIAFAFIFSALLMIVSILLPLIFSIVGAIKAATRIGKPKAFMGIGMAVASMVIFAAAIVFIYISNVLSGSSAINNLYDSYGSYYNVPFTSFVNTGFWFAICMWVGAIVFSKLANAERAKVR